MAATVVGQFGWYQIAGTAVVAENAPFAAASKAYLAGSGQLTTTQANGRQVVGAVTVASDGTPAVGFGLIEITDHSRRDRRCNGDPGAGGQEKGRFGSARTLCSRRLDFCSPLPVSEFQLLRT